MPDVDLDVLEADLLELALEELVGRPELHRGLDRVRQLGELVLQRALAEQIGDLDERPAQRHGHERLTARRDDPRELLEHALALGGRRQRMERACRARTRPPGTAS